MHYVIGDLHGHYTCFMDMLKKLDLKEADRVILVGDILDRAPSAEEQKKLIDWCFKNISKDGKYQMVLGNHEFVVEQLIKGTLYNRRFSENGIISKAELLNHLVEEDTHYQTFRICKEAGVDIITLYEFINERPLYIRVELEGKVYVITHSWLIGNGSLDLRSYKLSDLDNMECITHLSVWDRDSSTQAECSDFTIIHGHTPTVSDLYNQGGKAEIVRKKGNINIDCGLFLRDYGRPGNLAAYCIETGEVTYLF